MGLVLEVHIKGTNLQRIQQLNQMGSQIYTPTPRLCCQLPKTKSSTQLSSSYSSLQFKPRINILCSQQQPECSGVVVTEIPKISTTCTYNVDFKTSEGCKLGISRFPDFVYNAQGGTGTGVGKRIEDELYVEFDLEKLFIPPLTFATTKFLGLPLPPFLRIDIVPELFRGYINQETGKVNLEFKANFWFSVGTIYRAPPLLVETLLTSEESKGKIREGNGERLNEEGRCRLVGVAAVEPIDDLFVNTFLSLPTECLANMNATITFSST